MIVSAAAALLVLAHHVRPPLQGCSWGVDDPGSGSFVCVRPGSRLDGTPAARPRTLSAEIGVPLIRSDGGHALVGLTGLPEGEVLSSPPNTLRHFVTGSEVG